jgi:protein-disulfide isomerase
MTYSPQLSKAQRRQAAREEAQRLAEQNAARDARFRRIIWGALAAAVVALVAVVLLVARPWQREAGIPEFEIVPMAQLANVPANTTADGGIGLAAGGVATGVLDPNLPTVDIWFDYMCPFCQQFELINIAGLEELADNGEANIVFHPVAILNHFTPRTHFSTRAVSATGWIADHSPEHFSAFHLGMFLNQPSETGGDMTNAQMAQIAGAVGVPADIAEGIADGTALNTFGQWAVSLTNQAVTNPDITGERGFAVPAVFIDGEPLGDWSVPENLLEAVRAAR